MDAVQILARDGKFGSSWTDIGSCDQPRCLACLRGKLHKRAISKTGAPLKALHLKPGDGISCDQIESNAPGMIPTLKGHPRTDSHGVATLFVDDASSFCHLTLHHSTTAKEALDAKHRFEKIASDLGVKPKHYHGDNGVFAANSYKQDCIAAGQSFNFSAPMAKWQNGVAERYIRTLTERARTMLLNAMHLWPDIITQDLWTFALKLAVDVHNHTPGISGLSPIEIFSGSSDNNRLSDFHLFGCPVFVLEASLQHGHKIPK